MTATIVEFQKGKAKAQPTAAQPDERMYWRAVVRTGSQFAASRQGDRLEWHLAKCAAHESEGAHCSEGHSELARVGQPNGHCLVDGRCGLCGEEEQHAPRRAA
jgi:hypothetical protein